MSHSICLLCRGSHEFGMGHLHRSMWLLEVLSGCGRDLQIRICCLPSDEAKQYYAGFDINVEFADWLDPAIELPESDLVIVDWLDSSPEYISGLRKNSRSVMLLDDYGDAVSNADLVIQSLLSNIASSHGRSGSAEVLSGIQYLQLSPSILRIRYGAEASRKAIEAELAEDTERTPGPVRGIMLSFGGTPRAEPTGFILRILAELGYREKVIVKPAPADLQVPAGLDVELHEDTRNFHELLSACDLCVIGGGLTLYEAVFLGVPPLVLPIVDHQMETARKLSAAGCCQIGGMADELKHNLVAGRLMELLGSVSLRERLIHNGMRLMDGKGIFRTLDAILALLDSKSS